METQRWEYKIVETPGLMAKKQWPDLTASFDQLGEVGWEAVGFWGQTAILFKRRIN